MGHEKIGAKQTCRRRWCLEEFGIGKVSIVSALMHHWLRGCPRWVGGSIARASRLTLERWWSRESPGLPAMVFP